MIHISPNFYAVPIPTTLGHVKIKVTDLEISRNKMCNIRRAILSLSGDRSCLWDIFSSFFSGPDCFQQILKICVNHGFLDGFFLKDGASGQCLHCLPLIQQFLDTSTNEPAHDKTYNKTCPTSGNSDQPAHLHSLIRVFADCM